MTKFLIDRAVSGQIFSRLEAEEVMEELLSGRIQTADIVRLLRAMNVRPVRVDELAGFASVMRRHAARLLRRPRERELRSMATARRTQEAVPRTLLKRWA
jgi:anthranilate phosphoribosyltransferase